MLFLMDNNLGKIGLSNQALANEMRAEAQYQATSAVYNHMSPFPEPKPFNWGYFFAPFIVTRALGNYLGKLFDDFSLLNEVKSFNLAEQTPFENRRKCDLPGCFCQRTNW
jgi:hypothetical protein